MEISKEEDSKDYPELDTIIEVLSPVKASPTEFSWDLPGYSNDWVVLGEGRSKVKLAHHILTKQPVEYGN